MPNQYQSKAFEGSELVIANRDYVFEFLDKLNAFRSEGILADCIICVGKKEYKCHKNVLAVSSPYFRAMFSSNLKESRQTKITFNEVCEETMNKIIDYAYTGKIEINESNAEEILSTAHFFDYPKIVEGACEILKKHLDESNCRDVLKLAKLYNCSELEKAAKSFMQSHFDTVLESNQFVLLDVEDVIEMISSEDLDVSKEQTVYSAVKKWVNHDTNNRVQYFGRLLKCVRLNYVNDVKERLSEDSEIYSLKWNYVEELLTVKKPARLSTVARDLLLMISQDSELCTYDPLKRKWSSIGSSGGNLKDFGLSVLDNRIYVSGGTTNSQIVKTCHIFDCIDHKWSRIADTISPRSNHASTACKGKIFIIGGYTYIDKNNKTVCETIECYNPSTEQWTEVGRNEFSRVNSQVVPFDDILFEIGGSLHNSYCRELGSYELRPDGLVVYKKEQLILPEAVECIMMLKLNELFYVFCKGSRTVFVMNPKRRTLKRLTDMINEYNRIGAAVSEGKLYVSGKFNNELYIDCFDPVNRTWENIERISKSKFPCQACATVRAC